ncbi:Multimodular transpeptidase-transglycosylase [hydrothermal vent metagenome]|uniref:peptidoglycan glycosyltransferase n=1 Tax=hydrothermal vent metagenome TaxID=652676 RepID=A0A1W1C1Z0_9ZZZZ
MISGLIKGSIMLVMIFAIALMAAFIYAYEEIKLDADKLINYKPEISSVILDRNGKQLAYVFKDRHRLYARYDELPGYLIEALVAVEDTKFFEHHGVNPDAIIRAIVTDIKAGKFVEGGSTLTQQLIKNKLLSNEKKLARKIKEAILALKIEHELTKEEILERYLNEIFFGNGYYGIKTAAKGFFHKDLQELTLKESAILVGLPNAPSYLNPVKHYKRSLIRANAVLYRMKSIGWLNEQEYVDAIKETPKVYKSTLTQNIAPYIVDEVQRRFKGRLGDIRTGGYKIYTTVDMKQQKIARDAINFAYKKALKKYKESPKKSTLNGAMISVESSSGDILAMVGGVDYKRSAFNRITQTNRQPGSAFKPFIYQTALDMGYNPASKLTDLARTFQYYKNGERVIWSPKNYEGDFKGFIRLREALVHSRNLATVNLVFDIGVSTIRKRLALLDVPHIPRDMSIALGNLGLSPLKMAQIFSVFANAGHMIEPRLVSKIVSKEGAVIYETRPKEIANFTEPQQAYLMTDILKDVIKRGTGRKAQVDGIELAGKTGTTNDNVDAWFCGYSPTIETVVWFGRDNNRRIGKRATGGILAAPAFAYYYRELLKIYPEMPRRFQRPDGVYDGVINGKVELYTDISPLPNSQASIDEERREQRERVEESSDYVAQEEDVDPVDTISSDQNDQVAREDDGLLGLFGDVGSSKPESETTTDDEFFREDDGRVSATVDGDSIVLHPRANSKRNSIEITDGADSQIVEFRPRKKGDSDKYIVDDKKSIFDKEPQGNSDALHPKRKPPKSTDAEDSGTLF